MEDICMNCFWLFSPPWNQDSTESGTNTLLPTTEINSKTCIFLLIPPCVVMLYVPATALSFYFWIPSSLLLAGRTVLVFQKKVSVQKVEEKFWRCFLISVDAVFLTPFWGWPFGFHLVDLLCCLSFHQPLHINRCCFCFFTLLFLYSSLQPADADASVNTGGHFSDNRGV